MLKRINEHLTDNNILKEEQFDFVTELNPQKIERKCA